MFAMTARAPADITNGARFDSPGRSAAKPWVVELINVQCPIGARFQNRPSRIPLKKSRPVGASKSFVVRQPRADRPGLSNLAPLGLGRRCPTMKHVLLKLATCVSISNVSLASDDDDEEAQPGLVARYAAGDKTIDRIDRDVQFAWGAGNPDARLPTGGFSGRWTGQILIRTEGKHAFHLYLS